MYIQQVNQDGVSIALIRSEKPLMTDVQSALDLMMTVTILDPSGDTAVHK